MAYSRTTWVDEVLAGAERFTIKENNGDAFKDNMQIALETSVTSAGTTVDAAHLNNIETELVTLDAAMIQGPVYRRQGGSATVWSTAGTNTYTPATSRIEVGAITWTGSAINSAYKDVTFPVAFSYAPIVTAVVTNAFNLASTFVISVTGASTTGCRIYWGNLLGSTETSVTMNWMAMGPA